MSLTHQHIELLSPARTADIGIEAIYHGADAVYIGGPGFGARSSADNSIVDIFRLVRHAHRFKSRVFVTMNTILHDSELEIARQQAWQLYEAGVDALIVQDMGLLALEDMPPIQLHASTQCDIRTPEKARFLQDVGFTQIVLARELTLPQIAAIRAATDLERCTLEFFVHGALCVAYSGQCYISAAHTGRSANRGECSQACRLPYQVLDSAGRFVAHDKHVLSMKDNNQSENLAALVKAGVRSFKIEGRYKDMGYVKNITAHYRKLLDAFMENQDFSRSSSGCTTFTFEPDPHQNFNREFTDYFVQGRKTDIGAFDSPKNPGQPIGYVTQINTETGSVELALTDPQMQLSNGDGLCYYNLQKELTGLAINRAESIRVKKGLWRVFPKDPLSGLKDLRKGVEINRNRDVHWTRALEKKSSDRRIEISLYLERTLKGLRLTVTDEDDFSATAETHAKLEPAKDAEVANTAIQESLNKLGTTIFVANYVDISSVTSQNGTGHSVFIPASLLNMLRREVIEKLEIIRLQGWERQPPGKRVEPPVPYPEGHLTYLANVLNQAAHRFYQRHGVEVIAPAYEAAQESGEVSLMITKHCVRFSLSLCPKQAKGVIGVQGQVRAEPLQLINGKEKLTLRFDCKPCEMHVMGKMKIGVMNLLRVDH
ncbi:MAG: hypothetical protein RIR79_1882 [Pseudomonadota bacterium]|jgi:putative protease